YRGSGGLAPCKHGKQGVAKKRLGFRIPLGVRLCVRQQALVPGERGGVGFREPPKSPSDAESFRNDGSALAVPVDSNTLGARGRIERELARNMQRRQCGCYEHRLESAHSFCPDQDAAAERSAGKKIGMLLRCLAVFATQCCHAALYIGVEQL